MTQVAERNDTDITEQGCWFQIYPGQPPVYVVHKSHIKRLISEGARQVADPRMPVVAVPEQGGIDIAAELAKLQAEREALEQLRKQIEEERKASIAAAREGFSSKPATSKAR